jgi:drug/metabolite transporter (DMT)-like permease
LDALVLVLLAWGIDHFAIHWTLSFIVALGWMVLVVSVGATMILYYLLRQRSLTSVTSLFYCVPPVTAVLDYVIFGHLLPALAMLGMAFVVVGLVLVNRQPSYVKGR